MLIIKIPKSELWDEVKEEFLNFDGQTIKLEHSLISLSKWESKWHKPFMALEKTTEETLDYIRCMTISQNIKPETYKYLSKDNLKDIDDYIDSTMTATTFRKSNKKVTKGETITAELIYYWMITFNIYMECEKWHLNRLLTLINVCNVKNQPAKKRSENEIRSNNRSENERRKAKYNTKG